MSLLTIYARLQVAAIKDAQAVAAGFKRPLLVLRCQVTGHQWEGIRFHAMSKLRCERCRWEP